MIKDDDKEVWTQECVNIRDGNIIIYFIKPRIFSFMILTHGNARVATTIEITTTIEIIISIVVENKFQT